LVQHVLEFPLGYYYDFAIFENEFVTSDSCHFPPERLNFDSVVSVVGIQAGDRGISIVVAIAIPRHVQILVHRLGVPEIQEIYTDIVRN
jgi:hypothetical protein